MLLAELVGLIVLERHQLFEPVDEKVDEMRDDVKALRNELSQLGERLNSSGQVIFLSNPSQTVRTMTRAMHEALARDQTEPQVLRWVRLANYPRIHSNPEFGNEFSEMLAAVMAFNLLPGDAHDAKTRSWTNRSILTFTNTEGFDRWHQHAAPVFIAGNPLNVESKLLIRPRARAEAFLTPNLVTDREVIVTLDEDGANNRWGFRFQGRQYVAVFARWFDDLWASIPDSYLISSRNGVNQQALDRIRKELEAAESAGERRTG